MWVVLYKKEVNTSLKSIDLDQPTQSPQADLGQYFSLMVHFVSVHPRTVDFMVKSVIGQKLQLQIYEYVMTYYMHKGASLY